MLFCNLQRYVLEVVRCKNEPGRMESVEGYKGYCISKFEFYLQWNASL